MAGQLTEAVRRKPYGMLSPALELGVPSCTEQHIVAVILLDELEKAHKVSRPRSGVLVNGGLIGCLGRFHDPPANPR
jgi:hypothetical protein